MNIALILNRDAGTLRGLDPLAAADELVEIFRHAGHSVRAEVAVGRDAVEAVTRICREKGFDAVVVGGGDGTVSAAASAAAESRTALGILPLGTMNLFARALKIPLDMREAAEALAVGREADVDISEVNGRFFTHHVALGLHPRMVRIRSRMRYGSRWGKIRASVQATWTALLRPALLRADITVGDGERFSVATAALVITNDPLGGGHLPYPDDPQAGMLGLYVSRSRHWADLLELTAQVLFGRINDSPLLERRLAEEVTIVLRRRRTDRVRASIDGEIVVLASPIVARIRRGGLRVLVPMPDEEAGVPGRGAD
jgi:diacylglycerol kinase family enzyme